MRKCCDIFELLLNEVYLGSQLRYLRNQHCIHHAGLCLWKRQVVMFGLCFSDVNSYLSSLGRALNANQDLGVKVATPIGNIFGQVLFGWLADVLGRKRMCRFDSPLGLPAHTDFFNRRYRTGNHHCRVICTSSGWLWSCGWHHWFHHCLAFYHGCWYWW